MKKITIVTSTLLLIALLFSCRGSQQNKLIGNWERIPFTKPTQVRNYWQFYAGDALEVYTLDDTVLVGDTVKYTYSIDGKTFSIFGDGEYDAAAGDIRGTYWVDQLNSSYLKITKREHPVGDTTGAYPYLRIELVKR